MFSNFDSLRDTPEMRAALIELGASMAEAAPAQGQGDDPAGDNPDIHAGYTYLGQFIDHDITFDPTSLPECTVDPLAVQNFRTPMLELDSLYGAGPKVQPHLYERDGLHFVVGKTSPREPRGDRRVRPSLPFDLPRAAQGLAIIADPRNDENLIVAQLHLAFMRFHNRVIDDLQANGAANLEKSAFEQARQIVTWTYQWIIVNDYLPKILDHEQLVEAFAHRRYYRPKGYPFIPVEFAAAGFRLGHSMVRAVYDYNSVFRVGGVAPASLALLFQFSGRSGQDVPIPSDWISDFRRLFQIAPDVAPGLSRKFDGRITATLANLPGRPPPASLAVINLLRGLSLQLPTGQAVAQRFRLPVLRPDEIAAAGEDGAAAAARGFDRATPLWYYILKEAELKAAGRRLGPTGSRLVAEVFAGLLQEDPRSYLSVAPDWTPPMKRSSQNFGMAELLLFVGDVAPVDDPSNRL